MSFNPDKCKVLRIHRSRNPVLHQYTQGLFWKQLTTIHTWALNCYQTCTGESTFLTSWEKLTVLLVLSGVIISNIVGKANRALGFIRCNLGGCPEAVKSQACTTLVRPRLEYACSTWDPHTQKHIRDIEGIQRRAARFVKECFAREGGNVSNLLNELE